MTDGYLRPGLPPLTERIAALPRYRGYPVPWFVGWLDADGNAVERGQGIPDFRVLYPGVALDAHNAGRCWICSGFLGSHRVFVVGPMCAVNRTSAEPPMHTDCAEWSVKACPFLTMPKMVRREGNLPEGTEEPAGVMLRRNPGVILMWSTRGYRRRNVPDGGVLFDMGEPRAVSFWREGRLATRDEIVESIESGLPALEDLAQQQGGMAVRALHREVERAMQLLPA